MRHLPIVAGHIQVRPADRREREKYPLLSTVAAVTEVDALTNQAALGGIMSGRGRSEIGVIALPAQPVNDSSAPQAAIEEILDQ